MSIMSSGWSSLAPERDVAESAKKRDCLQPQVGDDDVLATLSE